MEDLTPSLVTILPEIHGCGVRTERTGLHQRTSHVLRILKLTTEWKLDFQVVTDIFTLFGRPVLDLFASRLYYQLPRYVSWIADPNVVGLDAFTLA